MESRLGQNPCILACLTYAIFYGRSNLFSMGKFSHPMGVLMCPRLSHASVHPQYSSRVRSLFLWTCCWIPRLWLAYGLVFICLDYLGSHNILSMIRKMKLNVKILKLLSWKPIWKCYIYLPNLIREVGK